MEKQETKDQKIFSRVAVIRHVQRNKKNTTDNQTLTMLGEIIAFVMGLICRKFSFKFKDWGSSPQSRAINTGFIFFLGLLGTKLLSVSTYPQPCIEPELNDFTSDEHEVVKKGLATAKTLAKTYSISPEVSISMCSDGQKALEVKKQEFFDAVYQYAEQYGDHLLTVHGATIDIACSHLRFLADQNDYSSSTSLSIFIQ